MQHFEFLSALAQTFDYVGRRFRQKSVVAELAAGALELALHALQFLVQALAFGADVHLLLVEDNDGDVGLFREALHVAGANLTLHVVEDGDIEEFAGFDEALGDGDVLGAGGRVATGVIMDEDHRRGGGRRDCG